MADVILGNHDGPNGENLTYTIPGRGVVSRAALVREVRAGKHPNFGIYTLNGVEYVRANPDHRKNNNVNR